MKKIQYGVWEVEDSDAGGAYWLLYDSIEDAVSANGNGTEVYCLKAKPIGRFELSVKIVKVKKRKTRQ